MHTLDDRCRTQRLPHAFNKKKRTGKTPVPELIEPQQGFSVAVPVLQV
jgi:hypothetical protein